jgi:hypothetical protein
MVRSEGSSYDYISDEGNVGSASAVSGHKFHSRVVSSADEDLRTVRQLCVARVPPALHQRDIGLYPVAITISWTRRESSNLRADAHVTNHARSRILDKVHTWKKIVDEEFDLENFVVGGLKLNEDVTESINRERERAYNCYLRISIVVSTCLHQCTIVSELPRGAPGVCLNEKRPDSVRTEVEDGRVRCAVVLQALHDMREKNMQRFCKLEIPVKLRSLSDICEQRPRRPGCTKN